MSLSWCRQDPDLLLSCGKDNRALCWNPQTSEIIGELPRAENWAFQIDWCPRNPDLLATAFFDGTIGIHSIQTTNVDEASIPAPSATGAELFDAPGFALSSASQSTFSLKQPPKWLRTPAGASWGFGGTLVTICNLPAASGKNQSSVVHLRKIVTDKELVERAQKLQTAMENGSLQAFAEGKEKDSESWKALKSIFQVHADSRDELIALLGFSTEDIVLKVTEAVERLKLSKPYPSSSDNLTLEDVATRETVVSFAEPERVESDGEEAVPGVEKTPSEASASVTSDTTSAARLADGESTTTVPSLFGDDAPGTPQDTGADFFRNYQANDGDELLPRGVPHTNYGLDSSVAATIGSGPSSVTSEVMKTNTFKIYPNEEENEVEHLITKALVLGDFGSAVSLCLSADRYADAILLAVRGGPELLAQTQKAYFERRTATSPYLRLFQSIVTNDLSDIVQNADLQDWKEIFVVLCTFASKEEFGGLAEELGSRLEFQFSELKGEEGVEADEWRKYATLTYLAAGRLERLIGIWNEEMTEEEKTRVGGEGNWYTAHAHALQTFVEKVTVFRHATSYVDGDLERSSEEFKLAALYDRYIEYAELLASEGKIKEAAVFMKLTPSGYKGSDEGVRRARLLKVMTPVVSAPGTVARAAVVPAASGYRSSGYPSSYPVQQPQQSVLSPAQGQPFTPYNTTTISPATAPSFTNPAYVPANTAVHTPQQPQQQPPQYITPAGNTPYSTFNSTAASLTNPPHLRNQQPQPATTMVPPPPPAGGRGTPGPAALTPPPRKRESGWNDAPVIPNKAPSTLNLAKPNAITSPFPNANPITSPGVMSPPYAAGGSPSPASLPPPPRPGSVNAGRAPVGPPPAMRGPPPAMGGPSAGPGMYPPPGRMMSPPQMQGPPGPQRQPTPSQYGPPATLRGPGPYGPPPGQTGPPQGGPPGPYVPPSQSSPGPGPNIAGPPPGPAARPPSRVVNVPPPPKYREFVRTFCVSVLITMHSHDRDVARISPRKNACQYEII